MPLETKLSTPPLAGARGVRASAMLVAALLGGCASLPSNGPTAGQIVREQQRPDQPVPFDIVDITPQVIASSAAQAPGDPSRLAALAATGRVDQLGPGDVLSVRIFEVGSGLFAGGGAELGTGSASGAVLPAPSASGASLGPGVVVDAEGAITLPYVGRLIVAGLTAAQVQRRIEQGLAGKSQNPQVLVSVAQNVTNTVVVSGAVERPGRQPLTLARDRLLDVIAAAGGIGRTVSTGNSTATGTGSQDMVVRFTRGGQTAEQPLESITATSPDDLVLLPGDRIEVVRQPRTFIVFGATDRISQTPFESRSLSLAEALARVGGPSDSRADARAIFLFRYAAPAPGEAAPPPGTPAPIVYRLNMIQAQSYFLAQRFQMRDKDVIYIANARANQPAKLAQIINQLFSPLFTVATVAR